MYESNSPGFYAGPIEFFWVHQAFILAGLKTLSIASLRADWSNALTSTKLLAQAEKSLSRNDTLENSRRGSTYRSHPGYV
jgi:hypothetical protein